MPNSDDFTTRVLAGAQAVDLAGGLDRWLAWRARRGSPPVRVPLTWEQIDALESLGVIDWQRPNGTVLDGLDRPFYRGVRVVMQGEK